MLLLWRVIHHMDIRSWYKQMQRQMLVRVRVGHTDELPSQRTPDGYGYVRLEGDV